MVEDNVCVKNNIFIESYVLDKIKAIMQQFGMFYELENVFILIK